MAASTYLRVLDHRSRHAPFGKKARCWMGCLSRWEMLVYCLWVADYGTEMLAISAAHDVCPDYT
jgi:hypothetical protein